MRIAVDLHGIQSDGSRSRGIGRYSLEIIRNIIVGFPDHEIVLVANAALSDLKKEFSSYLNYKNVTYFKWFAPCPFDFVSGNKKKRQIAKYLKSYAYACINADIILITSFFEGYSDNCLVDFDRDFIQIPILSIFYDLIPLINYDTYLKHNPDFKKFYFSRLRQLKHLDGLLAISNSSAQEAIKYLQVSSQKVFNISSACDEKIFNTDSDINSSINVNKLSPFILYSGAVDPRKNVKSLIDAFSQLPVELDEYKLVLVGKLLPVEEDIVDNWISLLDINPSKVIRTGYLSDHDLVELYRNCDLFVFPSLHEGFGLPVLEAMACGAPVIGSNCTSITEVIELDSAMFDPRNIEDIKNLIVKSLTSRSFIDVLKNNSLIQSKKYSWFISAQAVINACVSILKLKKNISKPLSWNFLIHQREQYLNLLLKKIMKQKIGNHKNELLLQICASIDKVTKQIDYLLREISQTEENLSWRVEGPFDSSYSLSILNRSFADALQTKIDNLTVHVTEGLGDYSPNIKYMKKYPQIFSLYNRSRNKFLRTSVVSRNLYPPRVKDMNARFNILHSYGWEESSFPAEWVDDFNTYLQGITVMSRQVKKILIDNGVELPIKVSGLGIDHIRGIKSTNDIKIKAKKFKVLHISSCFPRKGIDILLHAFADSFSCNDDISLIIKTFDNPHNKIDSILNKVRQSYSKFPDVIVIKDDFNDSQIKSLYEQSDLLVAPSRGEGFGLPIAEAMLLGVPVITTNWGGQLDFCNSNNSWLIDYRFVQSNSHFKLDFSYWAEPKIKDLSQALLEVYNSSPSEIYEKTKLAKDSISNFKWDLVAEKNLSFINKDLLKSNKSISKIGWVSTWNQKCGIASYSRNFIESVSEEILVFTPFDETSNLTNEIHVIPSWQYPYSGEQNLDQLYKEIVSSCITSVVIQFNYAFFDFQEFSKFVSKIIEKDINLIIFLHSTIDPDKQEQKKLIFLTNCLRKSTRIFVHTINDLNRLKNIGLVDNVSIFPHPIKNTCITLNSNSRISVIKNNKKLAIGSYGFCLPNKGFSELIKSIPLLKTAKLKFHINIFSSIYNAEYDYYYHELLDLIKHLNVENEVTINNNYLHSDDIQTLLSQQDIIVYPYQRSNESSSASIRDGLASLRPVLVTPLAIFDDVNDLVDYMPGFSPDDLAAGIMAWYEKYKNKPETINKISASRAKLINSRSFSRLSLRLLSIINSLEINQD